MDSIPKFLASIITIIIGVLLCVSFIISAVVVNSARTYHASVIEEIEASNFDEVTIQKCVAAAERDKYYLSVDKVNNAEGGSKNFYKVTLKYNLVAPVFGKVHTGTLVGYASGGAPVVVDVAPGLYAYGSNYTVLVSPWNELLRNEDIKTSGATITYCNYNLAGDLKVPDSITEIGPSSFVDCTELTGIRLPSGVSLIDSGAFYGCTNLEHVELGESSELSIIEDRAFYLCRSIEQFEFPQGLSKIGDNAFGACQGLGIIRIPSSVTLIGEEPFPGCTGLSKIIVDEENPVYHSEGNCLIETATGTLIQGCSTSVIPADGSVTAIANYAFNEHSGVKNITIPLSVVSIGDKAFNYNGLLSSIYYDGTIEQWRGIDFGASWDSGTPEYTVFCSDDSIIKSDLFPY